jgi:plasmid stabilization system protein ParE
VARQVGWTEIALSDLASIAEFIARDSEQYARAFVADAFAASDSLTEFAERGRVVPEFGDGNIRELIIRSYRLIYRVQRNEVAILGLIHGARDLANLRSAKR